jgi:hypothetical protein
VAGILAVALTCSFNSELLVYNKNATEERYTAFIQFPFYSPVANVSLVSQGDPIPLTESIVAGAIGFVAVNGASLLAAMILLVVYFIVKTTATARIVIWDVFVNCLMGISVIIVAAAWNVQLLHLQTQVEDHVDKTLYLPLDDGDYYCINGDQDPCSVNFPNYHLLVIALVIGYSAGITWLINVWFVYRNTYLHRYELMADTEMGAEEIAGGRVVSLDTGVFQMTVQTRGSKQHAPTSV